MRLKSTYFLWVLAMSLLAAPAVAQQSPKKPTAPSAKAPAAPKKSVFRLAIINLDAIRVNAKVARDIRSQISNYRKAFREDVEREEQQIRSANNELAQQRAILSPEAFAEERKKFELRLIQVQRRVQERKQALNKSQAEAFKKVQKTLNEIVTKMAKDNKLTLIIRRDAVVFWAQALDITKAVLEEVDKQLPSFKVAEPKKIKLGK